jgi:inorganic triphosphatase YgiF
VIQEGKSEIEIALDRGEVKAGEHQEPICELELELLAGETADLLRLRASFAGERRPASGEPEQSRARVSSGARQQ